jgi:competence protein ComEC
MRLPSPLAVAIGLVAVLGIAALVRGPERVAPPAGTQPDDRIADRITGVVAGPVVATPHGFGALVACSEAEIWVWTDVRVEPGERIAATGLLRTPRGLRDPGAPPSPARAPFELAASHVDRLGAAPGLAAATWRWAGATQAAWSARIADAIGDRHDAGGAALRGIVTGDRSDVPPELDQRWRGCGIFHALSVSGLHLAVVAGLAFALLRRLAAASPWGGRIAPARWAAPPALACAIAYTLVTGAQVATLRALVVIAIVLVAQALDRPLRLVDALGAAAIILLAWHPSDLADPSFQLSFAAALALALRPRHEPALTRRRRIVHWLARGAATSAWVSIVTAPITAFHFHQVAAGGVIGNLVLTPILELVALPLGLAGIALGAVWPAAGDVAIRVAAWTVGRVDDLAGQLARVVPLGTIAVASAAVMAALVAVSLVLVARPRRTRFDALAWLGLCAAWLLARTPPPAGALRVTFLDVGQGDAALVELPDGAAWLVDAGGLANRRDLAGAASPGRAIARTLDTYGHAAIDLAIVSHPHPDHYLGFAALGMPVRELWSAAGDAPAIHAGALPSFDAITAQLGAPIVHPPLGVARRQAGVELVVWAPRYADAFGEREAVDPVRTVNDNSLVVEVRFAGASVLFTGDIEREGEDALVAAGLGHVDVVKVAHHGSPTSSSRDFTVATHPRLAVISCGVANAFGFPAPEVVERWHAAGARVERTDEHGAISVTITPDGELTVERYD